MICVVLPDFITFSPLSPTSTPTVMPLSRVVSPVKFTRISWRMETSWRPKLFRPAVEKPTAGGAAAKVAWGSFPQAAPMALRKNPVMPSFSPLAADALPAVRPATTRAVVP